MEDIISLVEKSTHIIVIQPENPDADSLGSSLALEEIIGDLGKQVSMYCAIEMPKYLRYIKGWDRVDSTWPKNADAAIIVDTSSKALLLKTLDNNVINNFLASRPVAVIDHHAGNSDDLPLEHSYLNIETAVSTSEAIYQIAQKADWKINPQAAENLFIAMMSDSLGLTAPDTTVESYATATELVRLGAVPSDIESRRREFMKKPAEILAYKAKLIERIEYYLDGQLAVVHIPWDEIEQYSDKYNPSVLVLDEMRLVEGVEVAVAIKTYPDGKLTGKIRTNSPVALEVAGFFGGGGHAYASGFKVFEDYDTIMNELVEAVDKSLGVKK